MKIIKRVFNMAKNNSDGDLTDLESQTTPNDNNNDSSSNSMLGSIFSFLLQCSGLIQHMMLVMLLLIQ